MAPFPELVAGLAPRGAGAPALAAAMDSLLGPEADAKGPYLAALIGVEGPTTVMLRDLAPVAIQFRTVEALASLLASAALDAPLVVALDDVHWADDSSLRAIERLLPLAERYPILFLLALRNDPRSRRSVSWREPSSSRRSTWRWYGSGRWAKAETWRCCPRSSGRMCFRNRWWNASSTRPRAIRSSSRSSFARSRTPVRWCAMDPSGTTLVTSTSTSQRPWNGSSSPASTGSPSCRAMR